MYFPRLVAPWLALVGFAHGVLLPAAKGCQRVLRGGSLSVMGELPCGAVERWIGETKRDERKALMSLTGLFWGEGIREYCVHQVNAQVLAKVL